LLVDTPTDLRSQLLREQIALVHAVLYTHDHADHLFGLDDLRVLSFYLGGKIPLYCEEPVEARIRRSFDYAFSKDAQTLHEGAVPQLSIMRITTDRFDVLGMKVVPIRLKHGRGDVLGFRFGNVAYCTDTSAIPDESWPLLEGLDVFILDALRHKPHPTHLSLEQAVAIAGRVRARRTLFTHMGHDLEHAATNAELPEGMELAYDGMRVPLGVSDSNAECAARSEDGTMRR
jgi:phosphoribosyl 1,2-cyclic phosphate phosphodiesterase